MIKIIEPGTKTVAADSLMRKKILSTVIISCQTLNTHQYFWILTWSVRSATGVSHWKQQNKEV